MSGWIIVLMCVNKLNDAPNFCIPPVARLEKKEDCQALALDLNKHNKDHFYCIPEQPKP